jgi:uncharacterized delta-60 repeat protein
MAIRVRVPGVAMVGLLVAGTVAVVGLGAGTANAWPGDPDGTWGSCGLESVTITKGVESSANRVVLDPSGNSVVGGQVGPRALVARFLSDGTLDPAFGSGGRASVGPGTDAAFAAVARQMDGDVVAAGSTTDADGTDSLVVRMTAAGVVDPTFHSGGTFIRDFGDSDHLAAVQVQLNGGILVGGTTGTQGVVARLTTTGGLDPTFNGSGSRTDLPLTVEALALQPDGKIVIGGHSPGKHFALMRLNTDGSTDSTFGGAGGVVDDLGGYDSVSAIALDVDGNVLATGPGGAAKGAGHTIVRRYTPLGVLDPAFHPVNRSYGQDDAPVAVLARSDGKVVVAANSRVGSDNDVVLLRFNADGTRDNTFGITGVTYQDAGSSPVVGDALMRSNGSVLVAGSLRVGGRDQLALFRYQSDAATAPVPAQGYVLDGSGGLSGFSAGCSAKPAAPAGLTRWTGKDVARGVAVMPGGRGLVLEGTGALHPFRFGDGSVTGLTVRGNAVWKSDMARGVAIVPEGTGGYVVDKSGGLHAFKIGAGPKPALPTGVATWPGRDFARGIALLPNGMGGYTLDAEGGLHPFGGAANARAGTPSWPGQDKARGVTILPDGSGGWVVDSLGHVYPFGIGDNPKPIAPVGTPTWTVATARGVAALP